MIDLESEGNMNEAETKDLFIAEESAIIINKLEYMMDFGSVAIAVDLSLN